MRRAGVFLVALLCLVAVGLGMLIADMSYSGLSVDAVALQLSPQATGPATTGPAQTAAPSPSSEAMAAGPASTAAVTATPAATATRTATPAATATRTATPAAVGAFVEYTVQSGDTLMRIARDYDVTVGALMEANDISDPDSLTVGAVLRIPRPE